MVYRARLELDNTELLNELILKWNSYSMTFQFPYTSASEQTIPSSITGLASDLKYEFSYSTTDLNNNLLLATHNYEFNFTSISTGQQESDKEWGLEGLIIESSRHYPLAITNDMDEFMLKPINKKLYGWTTYDYYIDALDYGPDVGFTVYTLSPSPQIGDEVFTSKGELLCQGMWVINQNTPYDLSNKVISSISGRTLTLSNKT